MALPQLEDVRAYLRLDTDVENELLTFLLATATAMTTKYLGVPLDLEARVFAGRFPRRGPRREPQEQLTVPVGPCSTSATITDTNGDTVASDTYTIDARTGTINAAVGEAFDRAPYSVDITVGFGADPRYTDDVEPLLRQAILDLCSDLYARRNPGAIYEQSGGQVSITYTDAELPMRTKMLLDILRPKGRAW